MKNYTEMTQEEIKEITRRGGDDLKALNKQVAAHLDSLELSNETNAIIADTPINNMAEAFGGLFTAEDVDQFIKENY